MEQTKKKVMPSKHVMFEKNMRALTAYAIWQVNLKKNPEAEKINPVDLTLEEMQNQWAFDRFGEEPSPIQCNLCNNWINHTALIVMVLDGDIRATIGRDCMEKIGVFNLTGEITSVTPEKIKQYGRDRRNEILNGIRDAGAKRPLMGTILSWIKQQLDLTDSLKKSIAWIEKLQYPPTRQDALEIVEYYKQHRPFAITSILNREELRLHSMYGRDLDAPSEITLSQLPEVRTKLMGAEAARIFQWGELWRQLSAGPTLLEQFQGANILGQLRMRYGPVELRIKLNNSLELIEAGHFQGLKHLAVRCVECTEFYPEQNAAYIVLDPDDLDMVLRAARQAKADHAEQLRAEQQRVYEARLNTINHILNDGLAREYIKVEGTGRYSVYPLLIGEVDGVRIMAHLPPQFPAKEYQAGLPERVFFKRTRSLGEGGFSVDLEVSPDQLSDWLVQLTRDKASRAVENRKVLDKRLSKKVSEYELFKMKFTQAHPPHRPNQLQWEKHDGRFVYVLTSREDYLPTDGEVYVGVIRPLVEGRVFLVGKVIVRDFGNEGHFMATVGGKMIANSLPEPEVS